LVVNDQPKFSRLLTVGVEREDEIRNVSN
jgi:hypothetical protein